MVDPDAYPQDSPEKAFAEFLNAWKEQDWNRMAEFTQKTWSSGEEDPVEWLKWNYILKDLLGTEIVEKSIVSDVMVDITTTVYYALGTEIKAKTVKAMVIREVAPYQPSQLGEWGINPISTLREE